MKKQCLILLTILLAMPLLSHSQDKSAYQIFDAKGKTASWKELLKDCQKADVVFFGEEHNNPIAHWLELELFKDLFADKGADLIAGAEMFERDDQLLLDEYLSGAIKTKNFEEEAKLWNNYATDYKPLVEFAKANKLPFIGTNIPRRYASLISSKGLEALADLSEEAKTYIAPLPIEVDLNLPGYQEMLKMMGGHSAGPVNLNFPKSQAIKDATMGHSIAQNLKKGHVFIHYNGTFHSDLQEGTVWYLMKYAPRTEVVTLASVEQKDLSKLEEENKNKGDFILVIPATMTKTY